MCTACDALRVDLFELLGQRVLVGQFEHQRLERGVELRVPEHGAHGVDERRIQRDV